ncbi:MAG TPA: succinate dehydrogenase, hydrophobic membrane anchor protein [Gammaproteobacteria bacterium]|nr:succinate dehydrogenase, hydrophobic membrane anchor protein [Gammaproteobacteria bacterium]
MDNRFTMKDLSFSLSKIKSFASSASATHHFWIQRLSALALIPLTLWFCFSIALLPSTNYAAIIRWLQSPFHAFIMILVVLISFWHVHLGLQVIIEDYMAHSRYRFIAILSIKLMSYFMMLLGVYLILKIALAGS